MTGPNGSLEHEFQAIREQLGVPVGFSAGVLEEAALVAQRLHLEAREDRRDLPLITIDPPESRDLDQAFYAERVEGGYRVYYAISDVGSFVERGSLIEQEAFQRGVTLYSPDLRTPLYPPVLCEGAASLLPDVDRPAILFTFELNAAAEHRLLSVRRVLVRSRAKLGYPGVGAHLRAEREKPGSGAMNGYTWSGALPLLEEIGRARQHLEVLRGGVSLQIKTQHVQRSAAALTGYHLTLEDPEDIEGWNAQISLMTGIAAAELMLQHQVGLLRVLDPPREDKVAALRLTAEALQVPWPKEVEYVSFIRSLDPRNPVHTAVMYHATGVMGGARYEAFTGPAPEGWRHAAIASFYAHVTAPLRRFADRYVLDLLVCLSQGESPSDEMREVLPRLPLVMQSGDKRARNLEATIVDFAEARLLADHVGKIFEASIIKLRTDKVTVQLKEPPVRADIPPSRFAASSEDRGERLPGTGLAVTLIDSGARVRVGELELSLGAPLSLRLLSADPITRKVSFAPAP